MLIYMLSFMYKYMHVYSICTVHCKCTLCCCACRFTTASVYYGLTLNATSLAGNDYFDTFLSSEASATPDSHMNLSRILSFAQARSRFRHTCQSSSSTTTSVAGRPPPCCSHLSPPASGRSPSSRKVKFPVSKHVLNRWKSSCTCMRWMVLQCGRGWCCWW